MCIDYIRSHSQSYNVLRSSGIWYSEDRICNGLHLRHYSDNNNNNNLSKRKETMGKLRTILKEYGAVGVAFHTVISLASLGSCYMVVKRFVLYCVHDPMKLLGHFFLLQQVSHCYIIIKTV